MSAWRRFGAALAGLGTLAVFASAAEATFRLRVEDISGSVAVGVVITDGGAGDSNPQVGVITLNGSIGTFTVNVTTGLSKPVIGGVTNFGELHLNSVNVASAAGTLRITLEDTGYVFGSDGALVALGSVVGNLTGSAGSLVTFNTWVNPLDLVPAFGPDTFPPGPLPTIGAVPSGSLAAFGPAGVSFGPGVYSATGSTPFTKSGPYALFSQATLFFTGSGIAGFGLYTSTQSIPEPASLVLLGSGLIVAGVWGYRRSRRSNK
jgi:hypothetical protein